MSEPYKTRGANQVVPYGPYGPPEVLIFAQKNSGKFKFLNMYANFDVSDDVMEKVG